MAYTATPHTFTVSEVVTAATLNGIRDAFSAIQAAWDTYTPSWTSSGTAPVVNNGTILGKYRQILKTVDFVINLTPGSTTTFGTGNYSFSLPAGLPAASDGFTMVCHAQLVIGAVRWGGQAIVSSAATTTQPFFSTSSTDPRLTQMTPTAPGTFASASLFRITGRYETA